MSLSIVDKNNSNYLSSVVMSYVGDVDTLHENINKLVDAVFQQKAVMPIMNPRMWVLLFSLVKETIYYPAPCQTVDALCARMWKAPEARALYFEVCEKRKKEGLEMPVVRFISAEEAGSDRAYLGGANINPKTGVITIRSDQSDNDKLDSLIFELANLSQSKDFLQLNKDVVSNKIKTGFAFAQKKESIEFESGKISDRIICRSVDEGYWHVSMKKLMFNKNSFEEWWSLALRQGHAQYYMNAFRTYHSRKSNQVNLAKEITEHTEKM